MRKGAFTWLLTRGILGVLLGLLLLFAPIGSGVAIAILVGIAIGAWFILDGVSSIALSVREKKVGDKKWGWAMVGGIAAIIAGILVLIFPGVAGAFTGMMIVWFMAIGLMIRGVLELGDTRIGAWGIVLGIVNLVFGIALAVLAILNPGGTLLALIWVGGIYGIVFGVASIVAAVKLKKA